MKRITTLATRWILIAIDVWLGAHFGFTRGLLVSLAIGAALGLGFIAGRGAPHEDAQPSRRTR